MKKLDDRIKDLMEKGVAEGVYPGAVLLVAQEGRIFFFEEVGNLSTIPRIMPMKKNTIFDLASLTKPLATVIAIMKLVDDNRINLDQPLGDLIRTRDLGDKKTLTPRSILSHCAGFRDWMPFYLDLIKYRADIRKKILREKIIEQPLKYAMGKDSVYSDLGFMILEWLVEEVADESLRDLVHRNFYAPLGLKRTYLSTTDPPFIRDEYAATEDCPWRKMIIQGDVHDENAYASGGHSGHAGLFGTAEEVFTIANLLMEHYTGKRSDYFSTGTIREFFRRQDLAMGSTWALGWDTPSSENSSAGNYISPNSVGHLGFSGTSLWMDLDREISVVFLSNRIHPDRGNIKIRSFRPVLHDLVFKGMHKGLDTDSRPSSTIKNQA